VVIPWQRIAFASGLVAVASLATLVVVTAVRESDVLSTVALALAILAFAAQLAIAIVQSQAAIEQRGRLEEINGDTRALLADISATTGGVLNTLQSQFERVLRHALGEAIPEAVDESVEGDGGKLDPDDFERRVLLKIGEALEKDVWSHLYSSPSAHRGFAGGHPLRPGDWVSHKYHGTGQVLDVLGGKTGGQPGFLIRFPKGVEFVQPTSFLKRADAPAEQEEFEDRPGDGGTARPDRSRRRAE
jgi:hypothetical protein